MYVRNDVSVFVCVNVYMYVSIYICACIYVCVQWISDRISKEHDL